VTTGATETSRRAFERTFAANRDDTSADEVIYEERGRSRLRTSYPGRPLHITIHIESAFSLQERAADDGSFSNALLQLSPSCGVP